MNDPLFPTDFTDWLIKEFKSYSVETYSDDPDYKVVTVHWRTDNPAMLFAYHTSDGPRSLSLRIYYEGIGKYGSLVLTKPNIK